MVKMLMLSGVGDIIKEVDSDISNYIVIDPLIFNSTKAMFAEYSINNSYDSNNNSISTKFILEYFS